ncbi:MAG: DNA-directed RNA polymerase subunit alpha, partial [Synergistaceae bacterium]|nr:DNA-directed RNA polymerase subunit alpha [Synergistaceae bacterium]
MLETLEVLRPVLKIEENSPTYGKISLEPLDRGYGMTIGNALRRVLLSSISGAAITAVHIDGVLHEFSTVPGVREDVIQVLMNLKHVPVKSKSSETRIISFDSSELPADFYDRKPAVLKAKDLPGDPEVEFIDPEAVICTLERDAHLVMDLYIDQGKGYLSSERPRPSSLPIDALLADAIFSPVSRVNYEVQPARVGQRIDYERLVLDIWTNGVISPDKAVGEAAKIIQTYFGNILADLQPDGNDDISIDVPVIREPIIVVNPDVSTKKTAKVIEDEILARPVRDLELTIRSENCLLR